MGEWEKRRFRQSRKEVYPDRNKLQSIELLGLPTLGSTVPSTSDGAFRRFTTRPDEMLKGRNRMLTFLKVMTASQREESLETT